ncbi:beta-glucosidase [Bacteroides pyogenes JCM 10003]|nr:beta-glucosidase [Bacteroides pyogenes JCM 10003]
MDTTGIAEAVEAARRSDVAIVFVGSSSTTFVRHSPNPSTSGEGIDLHDISLTGVQEQLIKAVYAVGKPVVVVLVAGKPFAIPWVKKHIPAVLAQWYAGEQEGNSIADILFGKVNPSGRLTFSFPKSTGHLLHTIIIYLRIRDIIKNLGVMKSLEEIMFSQVRNLYGHLAMD